MYVRVYAVRGNLQGEQNAGRRATSIMEVSVDSPTCTPISTGLFQPEIQLPFVIMSFLPALICIVCLFVFVSNASSSFG